ncbi:hypothetical protein X754_01120 [Mesorhizobium sp. LNJC403B00]|nr:hypothetical protein X754_01120 [Mesorhizobium sp. LNJC403B00]
MLALQGLGRLEPRGQDPVPPRSDPSVIMLQCERQGVAGQARQLQSIKESRIKKTCRIAAQDIEHIGNKLGAA